MTLAFIAIWVPSSGYPKLSLYLYSPSQWVWMIDSSSRKNPTDIAVMKTDDTIQIAMNIRSCSGRGVVTERVV